MANLLNGKYTEDMKIKICNNCGCYSPVLADTCCWCGSKDLTIIDGAKEVKREQTELKETIASNNKRNGIVGLSGFVIAGIGMSISLSGSSSGISITFMFGLMLDILGVIMLFMVGTKSLNKRVLIKYGNIDNFLNGISEQLSKQKDFTSDNNLVPRYVEMRKTLNNDFNTKISKQDFIKLLNIWFEGYISPEVIQIRINKYLKENKYKNNKEIASITEDYYKEQAENTLSKAKRINNIFNNERQQVSNIQTTGLDFGIVTNNVGSAVLYGAMNNKAHQNQYNNQLNPILKNTNTQLNSLKSEISIGSTRIYDNYKKKIINYLKENLNAKT